jgi:hypothetical protein
MAKRHTSQFIIELEVASNYLCWLCYPPSGSTSFVIQCHRLWNQQTIGQTFRQLMIEINVYSQGNQPVQ